MKYLGNQLDSLNAISRRMKETGTAFCTGLGSCPAQNGNDRRLIENLEMWQHLRSIEVQGRH